MYADEIEKERKITSTYGRSKSSRGGIDGKWKHDMFQKNDRKPNPQIRRKSTLPARNITVSSIRGVRHVTPTVVLPAGPSTLFISNLASTVTQEDLEELFQEFDPEVVTLHHDAAGNSLGTADLVVPSEKVAIIKKQFEGVMLDGQEFDILETNVPKQTSVFDRIQKVDRKPMKARIRLSGNPKVKRSF
ncbi:unnamed protein product [Caenorhabditis bovis]|uniref:RRM domain-containing protein n=1 Tax=Caenorhabditis bovis TaxID=2654633 RepID=A0A8S1F1F0_9PELO|nr:unnamed protein product [Caenorhabditis bovis]